MVKEILRGLPCTCDSDRLFFPQKCIWLCSNDGFKAALKLTKIEIANNSGKSVVVR